MITIIKRFIIGLVIGASMLIPGVSGGCMAIILGVYDGMIKAAGNITKSFVKNSLFLLNFLAGGLLGVVLLARPLLKLIQWQEMPCMYFFIGAIIACIPPLYRRATHRSQAASPGFKLDGVEINGTVKVNKRERIRIPNVIAGIIGAAIGISLQYLPTNMISTSDTSSLVTVLFLLIAGFILAVALVLPGISGSYFLLVFGLYNVTLEAIRSFDLPFLIPFAIGAIVGVFGTAKLIDNLMKKHPQFIYLLIIGFMAGSLVQVFPGFPTGILIPISIITLAIGFTVIYILGLFGDRDNQHNETV